MTAIRYKDLYELFLKHMIFELLLIGKAFELWMVLIQQIEFFYV